jgi:hypothetical protein
VLVVCFLAGCGGKYPSTVSGEVTLDNKKLDTGTVAFHPVTSGTAAYAQIQSDGQYEVCTGHDSGLVAGKYIVTVVAHERPSELRSAGGGPPAPGKKITPTRYGAKETSGLHFTVNSGSNTINLELSSQP